VNTPIAWTLIGRTLVDSFWRRAVSKLRRPVARLFLIACVIGFPKPHAQTKPSGPTIFVAAEIHAKASLPTPLPILVGPPKSIPQGVLFLIRGVPPGATFSEGQALSDTTWTVPIADIPRLKIMLAPGTANTTEFKLMLAKYEGGVLAEAKVKLIIDPPDGRGAKPQKASGAASQDASSPALSPLVSTTRSKLEIPREGEQQARLLMQKGDESLRSGKITAARLFYQRAAESGWAPAALALGGSYDADELARLHVLGGVQPNAAEAKKWYEMAKTLGAPEAGARLIRLGQR
jgi:hypothetical protein